MKLSILIFTILLTVCCSAYKTGSPPLACKNFKPKHKDYKEQTSPSPYKIEAKKVGKTVEVTISGTEKFKGFLLAARNESKKIIGNWESAEKAKLLKCENENDGITHNSNVEKSSITLKWNIPNDFKGTVCFKGTVVKNGKTFWVDIKSNSVSI